MTRSGQPSRAPRPAPPAARTVGVRTPEPRDAIGRFVRTLERLEGGRPARDAERGR